MNIGLSGLERHESESLMGDLSFLNVSTPVVPLIGHLVNLSGTDFIHPLKLFKTLQNSKK